MFHLIREASSVKLVVEKLITFQSLWDRFREGSGVRGSGFRGYCLKVVLYKKHKKKRYFHKLPIMRGNYHLLPFIEGSTVLRSTPAKTPNWVRWEREGERQRWRNFVIQIASLSSGHFVFRQSPIVSFVSCFPPFSLFLFFSFSFHFLSMDSLADIVSDKRVGRFVRPEHNEEEKKLLAIQEALQKSQRVVDDVVCCLSLPPCHSFHC